LPIDLHGQICDLFFGYLAHVNGIKWGKKLNLENFLVQNISAECELIFYNFIIIMLLCRFFFTQTTGTIFLAFLTPSCKMIWTTTYIMNLENFNKE